MTTTVPFPQRVLDASWRARGHLGPGARTLARRVVDPVLARRFGSVHHVVTDAPVVALTLDDGPDPRWTGPVLDVLDDHGVRATFFVLVEAAEAEPDLTRLIVARGHEIGLHGIDHTALAGIGRPVDALVHEGRDRLEAVCARRARWFRPPFGSQDLGSFRAVRRAGLDPVVWGPQGADWACADPHTIATSIADEARRGDIVLLHDGLQPAPGPDDPAAGLDRAATLDATLTELARHGLAAAALADVIATGRIGRSVWFRPAPTP